MTMASASPCIDTTTPNVLLLRQESKSAEALSALLSSVGLWTRAFAFPAEPPWRPAMTTTCWGSDIAAFATVVFGPSLAFLTTCGAVLACWP